MFIDDITRLKHMLSACREIARFLKGKRLQSLKKDRRLALALVHDLTIIGEAASRITPATRDKYPSIPWSDIVATRNRLIHGYYAVDYRVVWDTASGNIPPLALGLAGILGLISKGKKGKVAPTKER